MNCPICKHSATVKQTSIIDDRYGYPGHHSLIECQVCHQKYLDCILSESELANLYTHYYPRKTLDVDICKPHTERFGFLAWLNGQRSSAFHWVPMNIRVLDIGCGFGQSLGYHTERGCDAYGVEADSNIDRVVEKFGFKVHVGLFDDTIYEESFFDYVTMDQVIEHVTDPIATLNGIARILKPGGTAIFSTPNANGWGGTLFGKRWINWHAPYHLQFYSRQSFRIAAEHAGLRLIKAETITNSDWLLYQWIHLVTYPKEGEPSWFWSADKSSRTLFQRAAVMLLTLLHRTKINHLATRLFDSLGLGDNFVFVLKKP